MMGATTHFAQCDNELTQYMRFRRVPKDADNELPLINLPFDKALKGSITFQRDPSVKNGKYIRQVVRLYKKRARHKEQQKGEGRKNHIILLPADER